MQTRIAILALLSACAEPAISQVSSGTAAMRVDAATQRSRDVDRAAILQDELASEALGLVEAQREARSGRVRADPRAIQELADRVVRHRRNISALARELVTTERRTGAAAAKAPVASAKPPAQLLAEEWLLNGPSTPRDDKAMPRQVAQETRKARVANTGTPDWLISAPPGASPK
jgi:hypothetical protein